MTSPGEPLPGAHVPGPILATKLHVPPVRPGLVERPRLLAQLDLGAAGPMILVSAPAGFGKTSLVSAWLARRWTEPARPAAWIALDPSDNDPRRFARYLSAGLQRAAPGLQANVQDWLQSPQEVPLEPILAELLNGLSELDHPVLLVLDDYHVIEQREVHAAVSFLIEHAPPQFHMLLLTRADPPLPLSRWRSRGHLVEVRTDDLRFTLEETAAFLNESMRLDLDAEDVATLEGRTEGWIAGLQLAALSMQGRRPQQAAEFIRTFGGSHHFILDYLIEEVLNRQPVPIQEFLLQTSVLERLSGALCDAVTASTGGRATLEQLERANLFIMPLDDQRTWYRTHRLFGDLLRARLQQLHPGLIPTLHARAATWFDEHGWPGDAVQHAFAAQDLPRARELVERSIRSQKFSQEPRLVLGWLQRLPAEMLREQPYLRLARIELLVETGALEGLEPLLDELEHDVQDNPGAAEILRGIADQRIFLADLAGDSSRAIALARAALPQLPGDAHAERAELMFRLADAYHTLGELAQARRWHENVVQLGREHDLPMRVLDASCELARLQLLAGRLREAERLCLEAQGSARAQAEPDWRALSIIATMLAELALERGDLATAERRALDSLAGVEYRAMPNMLARAYVTLGHVRLVQGDLPAARDALARAERMISGRRFFRRTRDLVTAWQARVRLAGGDTHAAAELLRGAGIVEDGVPSFVSELAQLALARVLLAQDASERAARLLDRLAQAAEAAGRNGRLVEILVLQAIAAHGAGYDDAARRSLIRALELGEPEGYLHVFVSEGAPLRELLAAVRPTLATPALAAYAGRILATLGPAAEPRAAPAAPGGLIEPLSPRELEVLQLMAEGLSNSAIAARLFLAEGTVKTHTHSIFGKLGVRSRTQAVRHAQELGLV